MKHLEDYFNLWLPSPLQKMDITGSKACDYKVYVKRDDLIHHHVSGNKFRKLKYNFQAFYEGDYEEIIAFGGAFSNLLYTLSFIGKEAEIPMTFYIRGDGFDPGNPTLRTIKNNGIKIRFINRSDYRKKNEPGFLQTLVKEHDKAFVIPEGGSNVLAIPGSKEILDELSAQLEDLPDYIVMDIGTAGTFAGVLSGIKTKTKLVGIPVLKGVDWNSTIREVFNDKKLPLKSMNFDIIEKYHFGGFAKFNPDLIAFVNKFTVRYGIPLDPVYTGKLVYGLMDLIANKYFKPNSTIVWIHAGGLQGIDGFNYLNGLLIQP